MLGRLANAVLFRVPAIRRLSTERDELEGRCEGLSREAAALKAECSALLDQRDTLERERDELARHCSRLAESERSLEQQRAVLAAERESLEGQRAVLAAERESLEGQRAVLAAERDQLKAHLLRIEREKAAAEADLQTWSALVWARPGHYYSPVVDPGDPNVRRTAENMRARAFERPASPHLDAPAMLDLMQRIARHYDRMPFGATRANGCRYYFDNAAFSYADAITLFCLLLELRPKRLIEVGCGFSSCAIIDTNERLLSNAIDLTFIDPCPETLFSLLPPGDPGRLRVRGMRLQDVPSEVFAELQAGDVLFLDTSHVAKTGSDVCDYLFRILPALASGVMVHVHDVLYPFEYPAEWIIQDNRSWNEAYLLRAFLQYNNTFKIMYWNDFVYNEYPEPAERLMPLCRKNTGGSIWLKKVC